MPANVVKNRGEEKYWKQSKDVVRKSKEKSTKKFKPIDWALTNFIFQRKKKKHLGKGKKKKKSSLIPLTKIAIQVVVEPQEPLVQKALELIEQKSPGVFTNSGAKKVVLESGDPGHFGKVQSDEPGTVFIAADKIKALMGGAQDEEEVVRQIALTIAHELGHLTSKFQGGEAPAETAEQQMKSRLASKQKEMTVNAQLSKRGMARVLALDSMPVKTAAKADIMAKIQQASILQLEKLIQQLERRVAASRQVINEADAKIADLKEELFGREKPTDKLTETYAHQMMQLRKMKGERQARIDSELDLIDEAQQRYFELTDRPYLPGHSADQPVPAPTAVPAPVEFGAEPVVQPAAEVAGETPEPVMPTEEIPAPALYPAPVSVDPLGQISEEDELNVSEAEEDDYNRLQRAVWRISMRRATRDQEGKPLQIKGLNNQLTYISNDLVDVAGAVVLYLLGSGKPEFLHGNQAFMGQPGKAGNEALKENLDRKAAIFQTYIEQMKADHAQLKQAKKRGDTDLSGLREVLKADKQLLARHIARSTQSVLPSIHAPSTISRDVGVSEKDLPKGVQDAMREALRRSENDPRHKFQGEETKERRPMWQQIAPPQYGGGERAQVGMGIPSKAPEALGPKEKATLEQQLDPTGETRAPRQQYEKAPLKKDRPELQVWRKKHKTHKQQLAELERERKAKEQARRRRGPKKSEANPPLTKVAGPWEEKMRQKMKTRTERSTDVPREEIPERYKQRVHEDPAKVQRRRQQWQEDIAGEIAGEDLPPELAPRRYPTMQGPAPQLGSDPHVERKAWAVQRLVDLKKKWGDDLRAIPRRGLKREERAARLAQLLIEWEEDFSRARIEIGSQWLDEPVEGAWEVEAPKSRDLRGLIQHLTVEIRRLDDLFKRQIGFVHTRKQGLPPRMIDPVKKQTQSPKVGPPQRDPLRRDIQMSEKLMRERYRAGQDPEDEE